jgi:cysteinyl-tRNA synthetase
VPLQLFNTLTGQVEPLYAADGAALRFYCCGPTVYDYGHIGNFRTFLHVDVLRRAARLYGLGLRHVMNVTDVDDKIIRNAAAAHMPIGEYTAKFEKAFFEDLDALGIEHPEAIARATENIDEMVRLIDRLAAEDIAYKAEDGSWYFRIARFPEYGKLSKKDFEGIEDGARVDVDEYDKDAARDFALWKATKPGETSWQTSLGDGRPGWHIECSAMACRELGPSIDIHGGGWDLQFPHHENEIAQSEGATGKPFAAYWMHGAFLNFDSAKMSKSVGNFFTTREVLDQLDRVQGPEQLRYFFLRAHYRSEVEYTAELLQDAGNALRGLYTALREVPPAPVMPAQAGTDWSNPYAARFRDAMNDDFDTPIAFAVLHELRGEVNRGKSPKLSALLKALGATIGLLQTDPAAFLQGGMTVDVDALLAERREAKKAKNYARADEIRKQVEAMGIAIEDKPGGTTAWRKK